MHCHAAFKGGKNSDGELVSRLQHEAKFILVPSGEQLSRLIKMPRKENAIRISACTSIIRSRPVHSGAARNAVRQLCKRKWTFRVLCAPPATGGCIQAAGSIAQRPDASTEKQRQQWTVVESRGRPAAKTAATCAPEVVAVRN